MSRKHLEIYIVLAIMTLSHCEEVNKRVHFMSLNESTFYENEVRKALGLALQCSDHNCEEYKSYLLNGTRRLLNKDWILPMIDSWGKFPSGILTGHIISYGQFDQCLSIGTLDLPNNVGVKGQYCAHAITVNVKPLPIYFSTCIPDTATLDPKGFNATKLIRIKGFLCQTYGSSSILETEDIASIIVYAVIVSIILLSSIYEGYLHYADKKPPSQLLIAFSLVTNSKKLFSTSNAPGQIACLHGLRAISMMWIIAGHRFITNSLVPQINFLQALEFQKDISSSYISSARAAVDTFFVFSALLVSYIYFKRVHIAIKKAEAKGSTEIVNPITWVNIPIFYIHRILRITPALAAAFVVNTTILRRLGSGPIWPYMSELGVANCKKWWWSFFLYIQNYVNYDHMCIVPTWYLAADMQFYLLTPFVIIPLGHLIINGKKRMAYIIMCVIIVFATFVPMGVEYTRNYEPDDIGNIYETHSRASAFTIGLLFGMIVVDCTDKKIKINPVVNLALWGASLCSMLAIVITMHDTEVYPEHSKNNLYFTFTRPIWCAAICWMIFACHFGYGGPINWFLSKPIFQVNTKLSFSMYLLHNFMIGYSVGTNKSERHFSEYEYIYDWCGDYIFTIVFSIIFALSFESPIVVVEKVIFGSEKKPAPQAEKANAVKVEEPSSLNTPQLQKH